MKKFGIKCRLCLNDLFAFRLIKRAALPFCTSPRGAPPRSISTI